MTANVSSFGLILRLFAMDSPITIDFIRLARDVGTSPAQAAAAFVLLETGSTIPFITRYRKDQTGGLDARRIERISSAVGNFRRLQERKEAILRSIEGQGELSPEIAERIQGVSSIERLEDLYLPYRPSQGGSAALARERGLEPLAEAILAATSSDEDLERQAGSFVDSSRGVTSSSEALAGAGHILAERFSERADLRRRLRSVFRRTGKLVVTRLEMARRRSKSYADYLDFRQPVSNIPPYRILAINRGERDKVLQVRIDADLGAMEREAMGLLVPAEAPHATFLRDCVRDCLNRLTVPSLERELRSELTEKAEGHALQVYSRNSRYLLQQPPVRGRRLLAVDPGFKGACTLAALDELGGFLEHVEVNVIGSEECTREARARIAAMMETNDLSLVAVGNGATCRETLELLAALLSSELAGRDALYMVVNDVGAGAYSTSALGREELPDCTASARRAVSIGRRILDPLSELVKIDPASLGVGLYQHEMKGKHLRDSLGAVIASCVNHVGVNVNTATPSLLRYVAGLNQLTARRIWEYGQEHGPFENREQFRRVPGLSDETFVQAAGFLRIEGGTNPLDATWIHPESYGVAEKVLQRVDFEKSDLVDKKAVRDLTERVAKLQIESLALELDVGERLLTDIFEALCHPGKDSRDNFPSPVLRKGLDKLEDLSEGIALTGLVLNVVEFGAFVEIGLSDCGLVHVSQMANRYIRDPHDVVSVGQRAKVWVTGIDKDRRRVSLSMIEPGKVKPPVRGRRSKATSEKSDPAHSTDTQRFNRKGSQVRTNSEKDTQKDSRTKKVSRLRAKSRPKTRRPSSPLIPLSKDMEEGREPMRTFGDLLQFHQKKTTQGIDGDPGTDALSNNSDSSNSNDESTEE